MKVSFDWLKENNYTGVTDFCRFLIKEGSHPETVVEVYRGEMLCLVVKNIKKAAEVEVDGYTWRKYRKKVRPSPGEAHG